MGKIQVGYSIEVETKAMIEEIGRQTKRNQGNVIDWLVSEAWSKMQKADQETRIVEEALASQEGG
jgi:hypothetical protein